MFSFIIDFGFGKASMESMIQHEVNKLCVSIEQEIDKPTKIGYARATNPYIHFHTYTVHTYTNGHTHAHFHAHIYQKHAHARPLNNDSGTRLVH